MKWCSWLLALLIIGFQYAVFPLSECALYVNFEKGYAFVYFSREYRLVFPNDGEAVGYELSIVPRESRQGVRGIHLSFLESSASDLEEAFFRPWEKKTGTTAEGGARGLWIREAEYERLLLTDGGRKLVFAEAVFAGTEEESARDRSQLALIAGTFAFFSLKEGISIPVVE